MSADFLKRHPFSVVAHFKRSLVLTYALPEATLLPLLSPGLRLDTFQGFGFLAIALVQTTNMRPKNVPSFLGRDFFLSGYRIFTRFTGVQKPERRGLQILRSDTDSKMMKWTGNLLTKYNYQQAVVKSEERNDIWALSVRTPLHDADLELEVDMANRPAQLPPQSPFQSMDDAKHFAGPLPFTFSFDGNTGKMLVVKGVRNAWSPQPVNVTVRKAVYLSRFSETTPLLANAFLVENIDYAWTAGVHEDFV